VQNSRHSSGKLGQKMPVINMGKLADWSPRRFCFSGCWPDRVVIPGLSTSRRSSDTILVLAGEDRPEGQARALDLLAQGYASRIVLDVPAPATAYGINLCRSRPQVGGLFTASLPDHGLSDLWTVPRKPRPLRPTAWPPQGRWQFGSHRDFRFPHPPRAQYFFATRSKARPFGCCGRT